MQVIQLRTVGTEGILAVKEYTFILPWCRGTAIARYTVLQNPPELEHIILRYYRDGLHTAGQFSPLRVVAIGAGLSRL